MFVVGLGFELGLKLELRASRDQRSDHSDAARALSFFL